MLSAVLCRPTALLVRLTFKESWDADNNPTTSRCEKTFRMVAECFDTALVILAGVALRKHTHTHARANTHTEQQAQAITITYHLNTAFLYIPEFSITIVMKPPSFSWALSPRLYGNMEHFLIVAMLVFGFNVWNCLKKKIHINYAGTWEKKKSSAFPEKKWPLHQNTLLP